MNVKHSISAIAASLLIAGASAAVADDKGKGKNKRQERPAAAQSRSTAAGLGVAQATRDGAVAGAAVGAEFQGRRDRNGQAITGNTSTTFGTGAINTTRNSASAAVSTGGAASGTGVQSTSSSVDAFGETNRQGSNADIYGNSTATSGETPRPRRPR